MIPVEQLAKRAQKLYEDIDSAKVYLDDEVFDGVIKRKTINDNVVKVFVALNGKTGTITKVEIYDVDGDLLQVQNMQVVKNNHYKFLAVVEIRVENEVLYG